DGNQATYIYRSDGALLEATNESETVRFERNALGNILAEKQGSITINSTYDKFGQRVALTSSLGASIKYQYDKWGAIAQMSSGHWQQIVERDSAGLAVQRTMSGGGSLVATRYNDGTQELRLPDEVGNLFETAQRQDRLYGAAGQLVETRQARYSYDTAGNLCRKVTKTGREWLYSWNEAGQLVTVVRPDGQVVHFTYDALSRRLSQYEDVETGLYYNRFRYYDPEGGQYISQDPIGLAGGTHLYSYVHDTTAWIDPFGLTPCPAKRPGGHLTGDVESHGTLSPGVNRATGHTNTRLDNFV
nr:type VI secretion system Vgr family protein [Tanacetum cinerariifolium]